MCNARALLVTAAVVGAVYTGGSSLGLLGGAGAAGGTAAGTTAGLGAAEAVGTTGAVYGGATTGATALTTAQTTSLGLQAAAAGIAATSAYQQAQTAKAVAENNARSADAAAKDALAAGEQRAQDARRQASSMVGAQRAAYSARGLDITSGTPADVIEQTDFFGQIDAATARDNARKQAWAAQNQAAGFQLQAEGQNPMLAATGSLLTSGSSVASRWNMYRGG